MTWTVGNSQSSPGVVGTAGTSVTLTAPTGITNGDLLHAAVAVDLPAGGDPGAISLTNAGTGATWTKISDHYTPLAFHGSLRLAVFQKIASSESGNYTASWTTSGRPAWGIVDIQGASSTSPVDVSATANNTGGSATITAPSLTGLSGSSDLLLTTFASPGGGNPYTTPSGMTTIFNNGQANTDWVFLCMSYLVLTSNASTSSQSVTATGGDIWEASSVAYISGGGGGGGGGGSPSIGPDSYGTRNSIMVLLRESAGGLIKPVRGLLRPEPAFAL